MDISQWKEVGYEARGARDKKILQHPKSGKWFLVKFPKYGAFEITTEVFNSILAKELEIHHVQYFPIIYEGRAGVACQSFIDPSDRTSGLVDLWEMSELVCRHTGMVAEKKFGRDADVLREHNVDTICLILEEEFGRKILPAFFEMLGFDALIGHGDRHWSNYGAVVSWRPDRPLARFSPLYDTASGYLTEISSTPSASESERLRRMLDGDLREEGWYLEKRKGLCKITVPGDIKAGHFDLVRYVIESTTWNRYKDHVAKPFRNFDNGLPRAIINRFFSGLDPLRVQVIETILVTRARIGRSLLSV